MHEFRAGTMDVDNGPHGGSMGIGKQLTNGTMFSGRMRITAATRSLGGVATATALILLVPLTAMQLTEEVRWTGLDFLAMGVLLLTAGGALVVASKQATRRRRIVVCGLIVLAALWAWAELAVGIFTGLGN